MQNAQTYEVAEFVHLKRVVMFSITSFQVMVDNELRDGFPDGSTCLLFRAGCILLT
jgi:hypothetical protein